ncbi:serine/threonine-protein kinase MARK2-like [Artibeus jamaicensis]|uniref:serine/threonine-protein kinase MARK2-like n=1 Tax=Artibeus jamaicensis TaxID=9417 RepID=UPI00235A5F85|nr:serine/threonine-protein kinase MARK2-like [Artibeus jamaicensis]
MSSDSAALSASEECRVGGYLLLSPIGHGAFAKVMLARHLLTGTEVAVKIIRKWDFSERFQEVPSLKMLNHPNITKLFEVIDTQDQTFLFMENVSSGHLLNYLLKNYPLAEDDVRAKFRQLASALEYCHRKGVIHRDLKPENILLDEENNIKLADFGFSTKFSGEKLKTFCGTLPYMAPEMLKCEPYDGQKVDAWSLGVTLYVMVTGKLPFKKGNLKEMKKKVSSGHFHIPDSLSVECQELLKKLLSVDPSQRISVKEIMDNQWINIGYEEALRPYTEPPGGDTDPRVVEIMEKLGYKKKEIEDSVSQNKFDTVMGTYRILQNRQNKMVGRTIRAGDKQDHCHRQQRIKDDRFPKPHILKDGQSPRQPG